ncbi:MAG: hypothetical protein Tsb0034_08230 [Ekhidna sp.]
MSDHILTTEEYSGTYKYIGGFACIDFINTLSWIGTNREFDWVQSPTLFYQWICSSPISKEVAIKDLKKLLNQSTSVDNELDKVRAIRESIRNVLSPIAHQESIKKKQMASFNKLVESASAYKNIDEKSLQWQWKKFNHLYQYTYPLIDETTILLTSRDHSRLKYCSACGWIFYDTTKNKARKWCDMSDCGSRAKSLNYYHKNK